LNIDNFLEIKAECGKDKANEIFDDFVGFLNRRVMNEVFYEYKEIKAKDDLSSELNIEIILHFLSKVEEVILLYETKISLRKPSASNIGQEIISELQKILTKNLNDVRITKGKIREIFLSYSS